MTDESSALGSLEVHLGRLLLAGVVSSAICLAAGLAIWLTFGQTIYSRDLLGLGLLLLMATPILRVVVSVVEYVRMRDWFFVVTTLAVLIVLGVTVVYALRQ
ncbi:MAG TPA: DUF1634 domain-containing protein [Gemmatimonadaceae bacterium]|nr:DUF1634 domain-containing protein [Vicinamibacterales bacterium]